MRRKGKEKRELEQDSVGYMPERFIAGYFELVRLGLQMDPHGQVFDNESGTVKKKYHGHTGGLRDEAALRFKAWVDRQLRAIGRDMQAYLNARDSSGPSPIGMSPQARREIARELERKTELKCRGCGKYISWQWSCCAWCGRTIISDKKVSEPGNGRDGGSARSTSEQATAADHSFGDQGGQDSDREDGGRTGPDDEASGGSDETARSDARGS